MAEPAIRRPHPHRWLQFRLRSLLAVMLLAATGAGITAHFLARWDFERRQGEALALLSGRVGSPITLDMTELKIPGAIEDVELRHVAFLPRLRRLSIEGSTLSDKGLRYLTLLPELRELEIQDSTLSESGLAQIGELNHLERLNLLGTSVSREGLRSICRMEQLKSLVIHLPENANCGQLGLLSRLESLRLAAGNTLVSGDLEFLANLPRLRTFWLQCSIKGDVLNSLQRALPLTELRLQANQLTDRDLTYIQDHTSLRHLTLEANSGNFVTEAGLANLARLTELRFLNLSNCRDITDDGLRQLRHLRRLKTLRLSSTRISDDGLPLLAEFPNLENLNVDASNITAAGLLCLEPLPKLRSVDVPSHWTQQDWLDIQQCFPQVQLR